MNYHKIDKCNMVNGAGLRVVIWVAGCTHRCVGCFNPQTHDPQSGIEFDENAKNELFEALKNDYISGITFSGGDPLYLGNRQTIGELIAEIKKKFPDKNIWVYTGYTWEEIKDLDFVKYIDVLCDSEYMILLNDPKKHWVGSTNQRVIDVKKSLDNDKIILYDDSL